MPIDPQQEHMRSSGAGALIFGLMFASVFALLALAAVTARIGPAAIPIWLFASGAAIMIFRGPLGQAIATRISGQNHSEHPAEIAPEIYAELDELRARVGELEERVDFSERLLTQGKNDMKVNNAN